MKKIPSRVLDYVHKSISGSRTNVTIQNKYMPGIKTVACFFFRPNDEQTFSKLFKKAEIYLIGSVPKKTQEIVWRRLPKILDSEGIITMSMRLSCFENGCQIPLNYCLEDGDKLHEIIL